MTETDRQTGRLRERSGGSQAWNSVPGANESQV